MNLHRRHLKEGQRHMIGARWANAEVGGNRMDHPAHMQDGREVTVTAASKALVVGERGIQYAKIVLAEGTEEEIVDCDSGETSPQTTSKKIRARNKPPATGTAVQPPKPKPKARMGARIVVPEGKTIESLCREGMALESTGMPIEEDPDQAHRHRAVQRRRHGGLSITLGKLVQDGGLKLPRGGYLVTRGRGRVVVTPAKS